VVTALYRRYRPETFAELIGQSQVTDPLRTALRTDRVNHAYLFSGPRGCGKTTSARILARCLNCAEGPTDTPCGVCPSCVELSRDGGGSLDVVEIDAASHNGVDDARDLRERAVFAPARDRFKIFILDEAHMVTPQGFNALLKIVEEPPEHVKFIFATTEPEKVIGTIRSRTHHYPFRLVPPAQMLEYVQQLCDSEGVVVEPGVLPLVVRSGGGSVRDTLSLLDQLIAGSEGTNVEYERAVALLGYTHGALLDEIVDSLGARDNGAVFAAIDRIIQTGQDPRRFVEDLLERLRDLIVVAATADHAAAVLRGIPADQIERMSQQSAAFGQAEISRAADIVNAALTEMTGATSPRLHLELMVARILVPQSDESERGSLARLERLERRVGVEGAAPAVAATPASRPTSASPVSPVSQVEPPPVVEPVETSRPTAPAASSVPAPAPAPAPAPTPEPEPRVEPVETTTAPPAPAAPPGPVTFSQMRDSWPEILEVVREAKLNAWMVLQTAQARAFDGDILTVTFVSENDVASFKQANPGGDSVSEHLRSAILSVLGVRVKFIARLEAGVAATPPPSDDEAPEPSEPPVEPGGWAVASIPGADEVAREQPAQRAPRAAASAPAPKNDGRYGEAVVREILGASFIEEQPHVQRVVPRAE
jgi:DNA polymerase-3 subunit gamma/tau